MRAVNLDWRLCAERHSLARYRPMAMAFEAGLFFIGVLFWIDARLSGEAFSAAIYGDFALRFPAEFWAMLMMCGAAITMNGLIKPVHRKRIALGAIVQIINFGILSASAAFYGGEFVISVFASVIFLTPHLWLAAEGLRNDAGRVGRSRETV